MCNAWNHPPECTCGWGGDGHLGRREPGSHVSSLSKNRHAPQFTTRESFVNPNAYCPVCGAQVFFYQSMDGGRVFFDELGPPWPKHPCTDNSSVLRSETVRSVQQKQKPAGAAYQWEITGWSPLFISIVVEIDRISLRIDGEYQEKRITLYVRKVTKPHGFHNPISKDSIALLREIGDGSFKLSLITINGRDLTINAFSSLTQARVDRTTEAPKRTIPDGVRRSANKPHFLSKQGKQNINQIEQSQKPVRQPAMALAFANAKKKHKK